MVGSRFQQWNRRESEPLLLVEGSFSRPVGRVGRERAGECDARRVGARIGTYCDPVEKPRRVPNVRVAHRERNLQVQVRSSTRSRARPRSERAACVSPRQRARAPPAASRLDA